MDDMVIWLVLIFFAWVAEAVVSARRKKRRQAPGGQAQDRPRRAQARPDRAPTRPREPARRPGPEPSRPEPRRPPPEPVGVVPPDLIVLREAPAEEAPAAEGLWAEGAARGPAAREAETLEREAQIASLETLEPAGGASHVAFHEKYLGPPEPPPTVRRRLHLDRGDARRGIVLAEILGRPKAMR